MRGAARLLQALATAGVVLSLSKLHANWNDYDWSSSFRMAWSLGYIAVLVVIAYGLGIPDIAGRQGVRAAVGASAIGVAFVSLMQLFAGDTLLPRFVVFGAGLALVPVNLGATALVAGGQRRAHRRDRVLFVGDDADAATLRQDLELDPERPAQLVGVAHPRDITDADELIERWTASNASLLVLSRAAYDIEDLVHVAAALHERGVRVRTLSLFYEEWLGKLPVSELERASLLFDISEVHGALYARARRLVDLGVSAVGLLGLAVVVPLVAVVNLLGNRGPLFYSQERVGRGGRRFRILKFRTMRPEGERLVNEWTTEDDPRITPVGRILRLTHVDEAPQVINIFKGDMSVVGPRPEQPHYVDELVTKLPFYDLRHLVQPGLTGWAQVKYGYAGSETDALEKLQYEFYYLRHQSLWLDLRIIGRTLRSVLGRRGR